MSFLTALETLLIGPLKLLFEIIFVLSGRFVNHPGLSIICLSLVMNILVLPLYKRADAMQEESRDMDNKLRKGVSHIKKSFSGDERMMILQTYYRQNHYKPTNSLNGSVSLLLEIPFFMAAYQFLSSLEVLNGVSLGPIRDLSAPDGLIVIGGITVNLLPVLMTLINVISSALYLKGFPLKTKIQLYGMALFFLVFLYTSPSGLVFYWTLNNLFSLVKTIFYKIKNPAKVLRYLMALCGLGFIAAIFMLPGLTPKKKIFLAGLGVLLILPLAKAILFRKSKQKEKPLPCPNKKMFLSGCFFLTVLIGLLIPSTFVAASPQEYIDVSYFHNPLWYILSALLMAAGFFLVWLRVFYWLAKPEGKVVFDRAVWILSVITTINYMFFGTDLGIISASLQYENTFGFSLTEILINAGVILVLIPLLWFIAKKLPKAVTATVLFACIALGLMSGLHLTTIKKSVDQLSAVQMDENPTIQLSRDGQNVMVIMLDRAMGEYVPYLMNEKPELKKQFAGFTWYANTISHGGFTNFGTPGLLGGYEYTPVEMNRRNDMLLVEKHNEALKVMPVLFDQNDWKVTVCDPPYPNYQWIPDLSIYKSNPDINAFITDGVFTDPAIKERFVENNHRNFFCFSLMKTMPLFIQPTLYNSGSYNHAQTELKVDVYDTQTIEAGSVSKSSGMSKSFMNAYNVLANLPNITYTSEGGDNTFLFLANNLTHEPMLLQEPEYLPSQTVDNTEYDAANTQRFTVDGKTLKMEDVLHHTHYQTNMAAFLQLGKWFDSLREQGVWDNTRIILVSDHGRNLAHFEDMFHPEFEAQGMNDLEFYYPLLMVKDFNSTEFTVSEEFMTNADVPTLATNGTIKNPTNPFTGKEINSKEKTAHEQFILCSPVFDTQTNNGTTFQADEWASVKDDMRDPKNWSFYSEPTVLTEHAFPTEGRVTKGD